MSCTILRDQVRRLNRELSELKDKLTTCELERDTTRTAALFLRDVCWAHQWEQLKQAEEQWSFLRE